MHTSMPHRARIIVTRDHITDLRDHGSGACLTWDENTHQVGIASPHCATDPQRMIIIGYHGLQEMADHLTREGHEADDEDLARDLTDIATDWRVDWPGIRTMNMQVKELRSLLVGEGAHLSAAPSFTAGPGGLPQLRDYYRLGGGTRLVTVTVTFGFIDPTRVTACDPWDETRPTADLTLGTDGALTHTEASRLIASTVSFALTQGC